jgi:hypothetical protein
MAGFRTRVAVKEWKCGFRRVIGSQALLGRIFSFVVLAPGVEAPAVAASGSTCKVLQK